MIRECGECNICCNIVQVSEGSFYKSAGVLCTFSNKGCDLFNNEKRPKVCLSYQCSWSRGYGKITDRPDISNVMLSVCDFNGGTWLFIQETKKGAIRGSGKNIIIDCIKKFNFPAIISDYKTENGKDYGDYVVIKSELEKRSNKIKGEFLYKLSDSIKVYKLNK